MTTPTPSFIFTTCQIGSENILKNELARLHPEWRFAFSRPGFVTFKLPEGEKIMADFELGAVFARSYGYSLGRVEKADPDTLAQKAWELFGERPFRRIHTWSRDSLAPESRDFGPRLSPEAIAAHEALLRHCPRADQLAEGASDPSAPAEAGEFVLDCTLVEPDQWWIGYHRVKGFSSQYPGGLLSLELPEDAVSRAWLKMEESLRWSGFPIEEGSRCAEIGSAPGGASQALLARGAHVMGIDPAEMDPAVLSEPNFQHVRSRIDQVKRREFRKIRWLAVDMNVIPEFTLEMVQKIVTHPEVSIRGMLLTLKFHEARLALEVPEYLDRIRSWGFNQTAARQMQFNRREICVSALKKPFKR